VTALALIPAGYFYIAMGLSVGHFQRHWVARHSLDICCRAGVAKKTIDPLILSQSRATLCWAVLLPVLLRGRKRRAGRFPGANLFGFSCLNSGVAASNYLYYRRHSDGRNVATAIILPKTTAPVWVLLYTAARGAQRPPRPPGFFTSNRRRLDSRWSVCALRSFVGSGGFAWTQSASMAAVTGLPFFLCILITSADSSVLARYDPLESPTLGAGGGVHIWIFVNPRVEDYCAHYGRQQWGFMLVFSLLSVLGPFSC